MRTFYFFSFYSLIYYLQEPIGPKLCQDTHGIRFMGQVWFHSIISSWLFIVTGQLVKVCEEKYKKYSVFG